MLISVIAAAILLFACPDPTPEPTPTDTVDFTSHNTDYSILVRNNTGERLVAFKGGTKAGSSCRRYSRPRQQPRPVE